MSSALLEVESLSVRYGPIEAVEDVSFTVAPGDVLTLLGPNGAGKTSTLAAVSRLVASEGSIVFDGRPVGRRGPEALARAGLVHVPEGRRIFPTLSVEENLQVGLTARSSREGFSIDDVFDLFPMLAPLRDRGGWALSGGEQQMLAIGRGLVAAPRVLLLDEPSLGLAPTIVADVFGALAEISERVPLLLVEQNTTVALRIAGRAMVLAEGRVVLEGTAEEMRDREALIESYLGISDVDEDA